MPSTIPTYWMSKKNIISDGASSRPGEKIVHSLHGGAYIRLSASLTISRRTLDGVCSSTVWMDGCHVFAIEYRLSKHIPGDELSYPFLAALSDALAGYVYLTGTAGFPPEIIIIEENAGLIAGLPAPPMALLLLSPRVDPSDTAVTPGSRANANKASAAGTTSSTGGSHRLVRAPHILGPLAHVSNGRFNRYVAPGCADLRISHVSSEGFARTMIVAGGAEMLVDRGPDQYIGGAHEA
ncbi:hypothetical protein F5888DRAFT_84220 [Russula emetica]|nr:hypothetical protein F5888DRAFT_84220 [Russula emetica]